MATKKKRVVQEEMQADDAEESDDDSSDMDDDDNSSSGQINEVRGMTHLLHLKKNFKGGSLQHTYKLNMCIGIHGLWFGTESNY